MGASQPRPPTGTRTTMASATIFPGAIAGWSGRSSRQRDGSSATLPLCYIYGLGHDGRERHGRETSMLNAGGPLRVVLVDDDPGGAALIVQDLESELRPVDVRRITDSIAFATELEAGSFDAVV